MLNNNMLLSLKIDNTNNCQVAFISGGRSPADGTFWLLSCYSSESNTNLVINVTKAAFGTTIFNGWSYGPSKDCSKDVYNYIANRCNNRTVCPFEISSKTFGGDPCPNNNVTKYFTYEYQCSRNATFKNVGFTLYVLSTVLKIIIRHWYVQEGQAVGKQRLAFAPSGQSTTLSCMDSAGFISATDAFYGSVSCWSNFANVVNNCSNKKICSILAAPNSLGTVPCVDPYKNPKVLTIAYTCLHPCFIKSSEISLVSGGFDCASNTGYSNVSFFFPFYCMSFLEL